MKSTLNTAQPNVAARRGFLTTALGVPIAILRAPLMRNGYALVMSAAVTSGLGLVFWILAARLYTPEQVGIGAALISTLLTLCNFAQLNLGNVLNRFLPVAGVGTSKLILFSYAMGTAATVVVSSGFVLTVEVFAPSLGFLSDDFSAAIWFVAASIVWTLFVLQDGVLAGLRQSVWIPLENGIYAVCKIGLLALLAGAVFLGSGIFAAWVIPLPIIVAGVNLFIFRQLISLNIPKSPAAAMLTIRGMARFFGWDYVGTVAMILATGAAPLIVLNLAGPEEIAAYYLAWTIAYSLYLIGRSMGVSLLAEGAANTDRIGVLAADALVHTMLLLAVGLVFVIAGAPLIMALFGPHYAKEGVGLLRVLALSCLPWSLVTIYLAVARANGHLIIVAIVQIATLVLALGLGAQLVHTMGAFGMGLAWLATHTIVAVSIAVYIHLRNGSGQAVDWMLGLASSCARLASILKRSRTMVPDGILQEPAIRSLLRETGEPGVETWQVHRVVPTKSDVLTIFVGAPQVSQSLNFPRYVLKLSTSPFGAAALHRYREQQQRLKHDRRFAGVGAKFPEILSFGQVGERIQLIERFLPGEDGRTTVLRPGKWQGALAAGQQTMAELHSLTATSTLVTEQWLDDWIDQPASLLMRPICSLMSMAQRREAIAVFLEEQHRFWHGKKVLLGLGHGDYWAGNILFEPDLKVAAIVDWEGARQDAPPGFDAYYLALTSRTLLTGQDMGQIVRGMLRNPRLTSEENNWMAAPGHQLASTTSWANTPAAIHAMTGLAWLHHVCAVMRASGKFSRSRLWSACNIERVLQVYLKSSSGRSS